MPHRARDAGLAEHIAVCFPEEAHLLALATGLGLPAAQLPRGQGPGPLAAALVETARGLGHSHELIKRCLHLRPGDLLFREALRRDPPPRGAGPKSEALLGAAVALGRALKDWKPSHVVCLRAGSSAVGALLADDVDAGRLLPPAAHPEDVVTAVEGLLREGGEVRMLVVSSRELGTRALELLERHLGGHPHLAVKLVAWDSPPPQRPPTRAL